MIKPSDQMSFFPSSSFRLDVLIIGYLMHLCYGSDQHTVGFLKASIFPSDWFSQCVSGMSRCHPQRNTITAPPLSSIKLPSCWSHCGSSSLSDGPFALITFKPPLTHIWFQRSVPPCLIRPAVHHCSQTQSEAENLVSVSLTQPV